MTITIEAAAFREELGFWLNEALHQPVIITHKGRPRLKLASVSDGLVHAAEGDVADGEIVHKS